MDNIVALDVIDNHVCTITSLDSLDAASELLLFTFNEAN